MAGEDSISGSVSAASRRFSLIAPMLTGGPTHGRVLFAKALATQASCSLRTIYRLRRIYRLGGRAALETKLRSDRGAPRCFTPAAAEYFLRLTAGRRETIQTAEIFRAYCAESKRRQSLAGQRLSGFERARYAGLVDADGMLLAAAQLPDCTYECLRSWRKQLGILNWWLLRVSLRATSPAEGI
jgi:hypothetical protein